ncbi:MAG TPA: hypothetical protein VFY16_10710 [Gemmatimonadaceae bacterium]|nr:hypothetical protein [Gemmatimonadaceae bacterium]
MLRTLAATAAFLASIAFPSASSPARSAPPRCAAAALDPTDRVRLAEAFRLADALGDSVWPGWRTVPFAVLLVTPEREFLVRHPRPSADFRRTGYDSLLASDVWVRARVFAPGLLATFPAVGGVPTIVVGRAEQTGKRSTGWVLTLLHEHFHQWQMTQPDYFARVAALGLARGDSTGTWMLNHPFPYDSVRVQARFADAWRTVRQAVADTGARERAIAALAALRAALSEDDRRYLDFQMWQEGVARYTELTVARAAAARYRPLDAFAALPDYEPYARVEGALRVGVMGDSSVALGERRRVAFYSFGAMTALMLDSAAPRWRREYVRAPLSLDAFLR